MGSVFQKIANQSEGSGTKKKIMPTYDPTSKVYTKKAERKKGAEGGYKMLTQ